MNELQAQLDEVNTQIAEEQAKGAQKDQDILAGLEQKQAVILMNMDEAKSQEEQTAAQQVRIQAQEEKVESITLPDNFNDVFGDPLANDIIIEVIKDFQRQANAEHNAEVENLVSTHKEEIRASSEREVQLQRQNAELNTEFNKLVIEIGQVGNKLSAALMRAEDAESKRDAAVRDKEAAESLLAEKQAHIDTLRAEIAVGAKNAINVTNINPSDRLAALVEQSKNAKIKSAQDLALENDVPFRGKVEVNIPTVEQVLPFQGSQVDQTNVEPSAAATPVTIPAIPEVTTDTAQFQGEVQAVPTPVVKGVSSTDGPSSEAVTREEHEALKARVDSIEKQINVQAVA